MKYINLLHGRMPTLIAMSGKPLEIDRNGQGLAIIDSETHAAFTPRVHTAKELYLIVDGGLWLADSICPRLWVVITSTGRKLRFAATSGRMAEDFARPSLLTGETIVGASPIYLKTAIRW